MLSPPFVCPSHALPGPARARRALLSRVHFLVPSEFLMLLAVLGAGVTEVKAQEWVCAAGGGGAR